MILAEIKTAVGCPFCGSDELELIENGESIFYVECQACLASGPFEIGKEEAIDSWDKRNVERLTAERNAAIKAACELYAFDEQAHKHWRQYSQQTRELLSRHAIAYGGGDPYHHNLDDAYAGTVVYGVYLGFSVYASEVSTFTVDYIYISGSGWPPPIPAGMGDMKFISLFSGIGGFDLAFERAGMECVAQVEIDTNCRQVLERHFPSVRRFADVCDFGRQSIDGPVDIVCGGFPCQDLSVAGRRAGFAGTRSSLFFEMVRITHEYQPAFLVWENVPGLLSSRNGRDFASALVALDNIGYSGAWTMLDAQFFGLAQRRRRLFGVFARADIGAAPCAEILSLSSRLRWHPGAGGEARTEVAATIGAQLEKRGGSDGDAIIAYETSDIAYALTNPGSGGRTHSRQLYANEAVRRLTPVECERLQGFPDGWTAGQSDSARYRQLGNAVAVPCVAWIANRLSAQPGGKG